jgi:hypothetical protein
MTKVKKVKKDNAVADNVIDNKDFPINQPVVVTALDPIYTDRGQLSYGFVIKLDNVDYSFRTNTQGYLELNGSGIFFNNFILGQ